MKFSARFLPCGKRDHLTVAGRHMCEDFYLTIVFDSYEVDSVVSGVCVLHSVLTSSVILQGLLWLFICWVFHSCS